MTQESLFPEEPDNQLPLFDEGPQRWFRCVPVREGLAQYTHLVRGPDDPERQGAGKERGRNWRDDWKKQRKKATADEWAARIAELLQDGAPRTFNAICVELVDKTADVMFQSPLDAGLWLAVERGLIEWTQPAPIRFRAVVQGAVSDE